MTRSNPRSTASSTLCFRPRFAVILLALTALAAACGGAASDSESGDADAPDATAEEPVVLDPAVACRELRPAPVAMAVKDYIDSADPEPLRFLNAVSTDSALPPAAEIVVQEKGPTFYWLDSEKNQQQIREKLENGGVWPNMLVLVRQNDDQGDGTHVIRVGGRYIGAPHEGLESPEKRYTVQCQVDSVAVWAITDIAEAGAP